MGEGTTVIHVACTAAAGLACGLEGLKHPLGVSSAVSGQRERASGMEEVWKTVCPHSLTVATGRTWGPSRVCQEQLPHG